ncbi:sensor histidine kinase [Agromyces lapidis]|uniref:Sensor histidine kinase n=1 Tax=Agromyces lapidis TaxID=279574 RepID=A0ABV5SRC0_9MICO
MASNCRSRSSTRSTRRRCRRWSTACSTRRSRGDVPGARSGSGECARGGCVIEIADNGVGFDPGRVPSERLGLRVSIEERIANVGGNSEIASRPGHGTTVTLAWPAGALGGDPGAFGGASGVAPAAGGDA